MKRIAYSSGEWHFQVPRDLEGNLRWRKHVYEKCKASAKYRRAVLDACRDDILFFINTFVWQFNPNAFGDRSLQMGPFVTWPFQDRAVRAILDSISDRCDMVIEKSREMGASWLCLIVMVWFLLFVPNSKFLCISRNEKMVDKSGDQDSLFWKIDFMLRHMPEWMAEVGPAKGIRRTVLSIENVDANSAITGQATTEKAGVGGRALAMFLDEFSQVKNDYEVLQRTADTTACRIFNGTHKGTNTAFHDLTTSNRPNLRKLVMHWTDHPDKNHGLYRYDAESRRVKYLDPEYAYGPKFRPVTDGSPSGGPCPGLRSPWYDNECHRRPPRGVAADLDINPTGAVEQVFDPLMVLSLRNKFGKPPAARCDLEWVKQDADPIRFHHEAAGPAALWLRLDHGKPPPGDYCFGADIAQGNGKATASCLSGARIGTGEKIFEYTNDKIEPKEFAYYAVAVARLFRSEDGREAMLGWEKGGPGETFGKHVMALGHRNLLMRKTEHALNKSVSDVPGWANTPDSLMQLILNYRDALRNHRFQNPSVDAIGECLNFVYNPDGYIYHTSYKNPEDNSAARVNHGDRTIADALCWKMIDERGVLARLEATSKGTFAAAPGQLTAQHDPANLNWRRLRAQEEAEDNQYWV